MTRATLAASLLVGCADVPLAPLAADPEGARLTDEVLIATGSGTEGRWFSYERADLSCTTSGGLTTLSTCNVGFTLAEVADGGLTVTFESFSPLSGWPEEDLADVLVGNAVDVPIDGTGAGAYSTGAYDWDWEVTHDGDTLTLDVYGVYDALNRCSGEKRSLSCVATFRDAELPALAHPEPDLFVADLGAGDLAITEVLADPSACGDTTAEWIEVHNRSGQVVDLAGLAIRDLGGGVSTVAEPVVVPVDARVVLGRGDAATFCDPAIAHGFFAGGASLNNGGDTLWLEGPAGTLAEATWPAVAADEAWSWDDYGVGCAADAPTPGAPGAQCATTRTVADLAPGDLLITEVMVDPALCSDTSCEWIEIHNPTDAIVQLEGLQILDLQTSPGTVTDPIELAPGGYAWLGRGTSSTWGYRAPADAHYGSNPALANTGDTVKLRAEGLVIEEAPIFPTSAAGTAWQLDPAALDPVANDAFDAWCPATTVFDGDRGTPGEANVPCP